MLALIAFLAGCSCDCLEPDGPKVDMEEALPALRAALAGTFTGTAADDPGDNPAVTFESCAVDGQAFSVELAVGEPSCIDPEEDVEIACDRVDRAGFPLAGSLAVDAEVRAVEGALEVWSQREGLQVWMAGVEVTDPEAPRENLGLAIDGLLVEEVAIAAFSWELRRSADDAAETVWEVCALPVETHEP